MSNKSQPKRISKHLNLSTWTGWMRPAAGRWADTPKSAGAWQHSGPKAYLRKVSGCPVSYCRPNDGGLMFRKPACWLLLCVTAGLLLAGEAAGQLRITLPKRSKATPVQKLNREGV